jgi:hypothetical protein
MGNCSSTSNCNPCGPDFSAINQLATKAGAYARQANTYATNAENAWLEFNALYLGAFAVAPTVDNEGDPLQVGALYWNSVLNNLWAWNGTSWTPAVEGEKYLGGFAVAPTSDNEGNPLQTGNLYWNTASNNLWAYNGTSWAKTEFNETTPFLATGTTTARNLVTRESDVINVKDFGAVGDGVTNDTVAIQSAVNFCISNKKAKLYFPSSVYRITTTITVSDTVMFCGDGWTAITSQSGQRYGSIIYCDNLTPPLVWIDFTGGSGGLMDIELLANQPSPVAGWIPNDLSTIAVRSFRAPFLSGNRNLNIFNVMMRGFSKGIYVQGGDQLYVDKLFGQWWKYAIDIAGSYDVSRVSNLHHWVFYSGDTNLVQYSEQNLSLIRSGRNDNPVFQNIFGWHINIGFEFYGSQAPINPTGKSDRVDISSFGFDYCNIGFLTNTSIPSGQGVRANISNGYVLGTDTINSYGIYLNSNIDVFLVSNVDFEKIGMSVCLSSGASTIVSLENILIRSWNTALTGASAFTSTGNSLIKIGSGLCVFSGAGAGAKLTNVTGKFNGYIQGNITQPISEYLFTGTLDINGEATVDCSSITSQLHTRILVLEGFAQDTVSSGYIELLPSECYTINSTDIKIDAGASYPNKQYRLYFKLNQDN